MSPAPERFPVDRLSFDNTDTDALNVAVMLSAEGTAIQTATVEKDAGGPEEAD